MKRELKSYFAGLLDADGCFHTFRNRVRVYPQVTLVMIDKGPLEFLYSYYGGNFDTLPRRSGACKVTYRWRLHGTALTQLLRDIYSFVWIKRPQVELLLALRNELETCSPQERISDRQWDYREELRLGIMRHNQRGERA